MPIVKASAIRQERIRVISFALLPPFLFLCGVGVIRRATGKISIIAAKIIATVGALSAAVVIAVFVEDISDKFYDFVIPNSLVHPTQPYLNGLDVICAVLIPIGIALWWRRAIPTPRLMVACVLGIAAAFIPVAVQVISRPFFHSFDGARAVAAFDVFAAIVLAVCVTKRFLKNGKHDPLVQPTVPHHIRKGLIRLYVVLFIPWTAWFGYMAYKASATIDYERSRMLYFLNLTDRIDQALEKRRVSGCNSALGGQDTICQGTSALIEDARRQLGLIAMGYDDAKTNDEIRERIEQAEDHNEARLTTAIYALLAGIAPLLLFPIFLWLLAGFAKSGASTPTRKAAL